MTNAAKKIEVPKTEAVLLSQVIESTPDTNKFGLLKKIFASLKSKSRDDLSFERWECLESKPQRPSSHYGRRL
jgi:hypothetical protein